MPKTGYDLKDILRIALLFASLFTVASLFLLNKCGTGVSQVPTEQPPIEADPVKLEEPEPEPLPEPEPMRLIVAFDSVSLSFDLWQKVDSLRHSTLEQHNDLTLRYEPISKSLIDPRVVIVRDYITTSDDFVMMLLDIDSILRRDKIREVVFVGAPLFLADTTLSIGMYLDPIVNKMTRANVVPDIHFVYHDEDEERIYIIKQLISIMQSVSRTSNVYRHSLRARLEGS